jgi:hypothetical protein
MIGPFNSKPKYDAARAAAIKGWMLEALRLPADTPLMVTELRCSEEGCPPLETVIAVLDTPGSPRQFKLHKPLAEVTAADVRALADGRHPHHHATSEES